MAALAGSAGSSFLIVLKSASGLRNADGPFGTSDPYVRVQMPGVLDVTTSIIKKNLSPVWDEAVYVATFPGSDNLVELTVMDSDAGVIVNGSDDFLGSARLNLTQVGSSWTDMTIPLTGPKAKGALRVMTKAYTADPTLTIVRCSSLRNADGAFGTSDPFCVVTGLKPGMEWRRTAVVQNDLNPTFNEQVGLPLRQSMPTGGKLDKLKVAVFDKDDYSSPDSLGEIELDWQQIFPESSTSGMDLKLTGKKAKNGRIVLNVDVGGGSSASSIAAQGKSIFLNGLGGGAADDEYPPIKISTQQCDIKLPAHTGFMLGDCCDDIDDTLVMGLAWDVTNGVNIDLDASVIMLDQNLESKDIVFFNKLQSSDGSIQHGGDEREGDEDGDDEKIFVNLDAMHSSIKYLGFVVNSYTGQELNDVSQCSCHLYSSRTGKDVALFDMSSDQALDCTAFLMCVLFKEDSKWYMTTIGEGAHGSMAMDNVDELQDWIRTHNPSSHTQHLGGYPPVSFEVPAGKQGQKIGFKNPSGGTQELVVPRDARAGQVVEVEVVEVFSC